LQQRYVANIMNIYKIKISWIIITSQVFMFLYAVFIWLLFLNILMPTNQSSSIVTPIILSLVFIIPSVIYFFELRGTVIITDNEIISNYPFRKFTLPFNEIVTVKKNRRIPNFIWLITNDKKYSISLNMRNRNEFINDLDIHLAKINLQDIFK
jgi:hypothetical protein